MNSISMTVADPAAAIVTYGAGCYLDLRRAAAIGGAYSTIATAIVQTGVTLYPVTDPGGLTTSWYKYCLSSADGLTQGAFTAPAAGVTTGLCSLADARTRIHADDPTNTNDDSGIAEFIGHATDLIHTWTGKYFLPDPASGTSVFYFGGDGTRTLRIPRGVVSVTTLELATATGGSYTTVTENTDFFLQPETQSRSYPGASADRIELSDRGSWLFYPGFRTVKLTGVLGHATVPEIIEAICLRTVVRAWERRRAGEIDTVGGGIDGRAVVSRSFSLDDRTLLETYAGWGPKVA